MVRFRSVWLWFAVCCLAAASTASEEPANGWRGNGTGLWPDAKPPLQWYRLPHGALDGLRCCADRPSGVDPANAPLVEKGLLREWLVLGAFPVADSVQDFDDAPLGDETAIEPLANDTRPDREPNRNWRPAAVPPDDPMVFGTAELPWLDVAKVVAGEPNRLAYAHTYLHSPRGGRARIVVDHAHGLKVWLNGHEVYRQPQRAAGLGFYVGISRQELNHQEQPSPRFDVDLKPGWNRLLLKLSTFNREGGSEMRCCLRIMDPPDVPYESRNILWMTELPARSTSTPIIVGSRIFLMAEPDELVCIDKDDGRLLWKAANNYYEALTPAERAGLPGLAERVDPLVARLRQEPDRVRRTELRREIREALEALDGERFALRLDGHFESHFGIVGFTMPTPVSDGRHVYVWCGVGVAACYDLDGNRKWITRVPTGDLSYGSSPALAGGVLAVFLNQLYGLNAATGELRWEQHRIHKNIAAVLAARLAGQDVFVSQQGEVIRASDGQLLFRPRGIGTGDTGWSPPVILGNTVHVPRYGVAQLTLFDFAKCQGEWWEPEALATIQLPDSINRLADGSWLDRWTAGSPLIWQGLVYQTDIYGVLYVADLETREMLYRQPLAIVGLMHYNAVPVAASPTLIGSHVYVTDNQGTTLVLEPGRQFRQVARNRIATQLDRIWPIPAQETLAYAPPIVDGNRLYLRGERYLYCIGEK